MAKDFETVVRARKQRKQMSLPEVLLWRHLRGDQEGMRFRRQHEIGKLTLDFYCPKAKLAIEVDGISHDMGDQPEFDENRDAKLAELGIGTMRIPAKDVIRDSIGVADSLVRYAPAKRG